MRKIALFIVGIFIGAILIGGVSAVKAYLTKQKVLGGSTVSTATVDLATTPQTALFLFDNILPGFDSEEQFVVLENTGSATIKYALTVNPVENSDDNALFAALEYELFIYDENDALARTYGGEGTLLSTLTNLEIDQTIAPGIEKKIGMTLFLPEDTGNDVQELTTNFEIIFDTIQEDGEF